MAHPAAPFDTINVGSSLTAAPQFRFPVRLSEHFSQPVSRADPGYGSADPLATAWRLPTGVPTSSAKLPPEEVTPHNLRLASGALAGMRDRSQQARLRRCCELSPRYPSSDSEVSRCVTELATMVCSDEALWLQQVPPPGVKPPVMATGEPVRHGLQLLEHIWLQLVELESKAGSGLDSVHVVQSSFEELARLWPYEVSREGFVHWWLGFHFLCSTRGGGLEDSEMTSLKHVTQLFKILRRTVQSWCWSEQRHFSTGPSLPPTARFPSYSASAEKLVPVIQTLQEVAYRHSAERDDLLKSLCDTVAQVTRSIPVHALLPECSSAMFLWRESCQRCTVQCPVEEGHRPMGSACCSKCRRAYRLLFAVSAEVITKTFIHHRTNAMALMHSMNISSLSPLPQMVTLMALLRDAYRPTSSSLSEESEVSVAVTRFFEVSGMNANPETSIKKTE